MKKLSFILLAIGLIAGIAVAKLLIPSHIQTAPAALVKHIPVVKQVKEVTENQASFQHKIDAANTKELLITGQLNNTKAILQKIKAKNQTLRLQIQKSIIRHPGADSSTAADTTVCTIMQRQIGELLAVQMVKDSVQDTITKTMEQQLNNKQKIIELQQQQYFSLKVSFDNAMAQQKLLEVQDNRYKKKFRHQKLKQKIIAVGVIIITTLAFRYIVKF